MNASNRPIATLALGFLLTVSAAVAADKPNVAGTWKWSNEARNGQVREVTLVLKQDGEKITGALQRQQGETPIADAKIQGNVLTFKITRETQRGTSVAAYTGTLDGDTLKGKIATKTGERENEREWTAKRAGAGVDPTGDWAWIMKRDDGDPWQATLQLKRDGEKITGFFQREGGDGRLDIQNGRLSGSTLTFETVMERDGNSVTIKSSAVIEGKAMKGKAEGTRDGQAWTREWEATRK